MIRYIVGILFFVIFAFGGSDVKGEISRKSGMEISAADKGANYSGQSRQGGSSSSEYGILAENDRIAFEAVRTRIGEVSVSAPLASRNLGASKNLRYTSTIRILSSLDTPLYARSSKNLYFQYSFVKSSCRYYVYTLRRLLN